MYSSYSDQVYETFHRGCSTLVSFNVVHGIPISEYMYPTYIAFLLYHIEWKDMLMYGPLPDCQNGLKLVAAFLLISLYELL